MQIYRSVWLESSVAFYPQIRLNGNESQEGDLLGVDPTDVIESNLIGGILIVTNIAKKL